MRPEIILPKARSLLVAPRMPVAPKTWRHGTAFDQDGDIVVDCDVAGCGWHAMGPRGLMRKAMSEHRAMYHSQETSVVILNRPR